MQFNPIALTDSYGTVDKYFGDVLKSLGYKGSILGANQDFFSANPEDMGYMGATSLDPAFQKWAQANGIGTQMYQGDDYNIMRLMQGDKVLGEQKYTTKDGLDKFAEVAGPIALAIGTGGVLGQAMGLINPAMNPLSPSTWGGAAGSGGAIASGGAQGAASLEAAVAADIAASQAAAAASVGTGAGLTATELAALGAGGAAAGGAAAGGAAGGMVNGAFLGEGVASGIPAWDSAVGSGAMTSSTGLQGLLGKAFDYAKENPRLVGGLIGGLLGGTGGGSGGGGYSYNGPMPTISRQGWSPTAQANLMPTQSVVGGLPQAQGQQYSGLLRYLGG